MVAMLTDVSTRLPVVLPIHPRGRPTLEAAGLVSSARLRVIDPLGYIEFMSLVRGAAVVITDSGGIQEETTILGVPCLTVRPNTERPITITHGTNRLVEPETVSRERRRDPLRRHRSGRERAAALGWARRRTHRGRHRGMARDPNLAVSRRICLRPCLHFLASANLGQRDLVSPEDVLRVGINARTIGPPDPRYGPPRSLWIPGWRLRHPMSPRAWR